jgi:hypothetical protein
MIISHESLRPSDSAQTVRIDLFLRVFDAEKLHECPLQDFHH